MDEISRKEFDDLCYESDQRIRALGDRIGDIDRKFDGKIKILDDLFNTKDDWKQYIDKSHDFLCKKLDACKEMLAENMNEIGKVKTFAYDFKKDFIELKSEVEILKKSLEEKFRDLYSFKDITAISAKDLQLLASQIDKVNETIKSKDSEYNKSIRDAFETIFSAKREIQDLSLKIHQVTALYNKMQDDILQLNKSNESLLEHTPKVYEELLREIKSVKNELLKSIETEMRDIFIPDVSHFVIDNDLVKLRHEVDLCNLDSKNAFDKSSNIEMQTSINSRKIESLQLKLNQLELKNQ